MVCYGAVPLGPRLLAGMRSSAGRSVPRRCAGAVRCVLSRACLGVVVRNTWWVTRPKRSLVSVPLCLKVLADVAGGRVWSAPDKHTELGVEQGLEDAGLKRPGKRRDQGGGGGRTYRAWLKSLGLVFMDDEDRLQLTCAGQALIEGQAPLPILSEQVYKYQFPSAFSHAGPSAVDPRFQVRPFIFLLQLLLDQRLGGVLSERDEIALIVLCYGTSNRQETVDEVVGRILAFRERGLESLSGDYVKRFASTRSQEASFDKLAQNLGDVANTCANWLGFTQLIDVERGMWRIADGASVEAQEVVKTYATKTLIRDWADEEKFQRRYGLLPGQRKDTRNLGGHVGAVSAGAIEEMRIDHAYLGLASTSVIARISPQVVDQVAAKTGISPARVEQVLTRKYPGGSAAWFMAQYVQLAFQSRDHATEFEAATTAIFRDVFGFKAQHVGPIPRRPDIVIASLEANYGALLDSKAYKAGYSATIGQQNRMRDYIEDFPDYALSDAPLAFFAYVVSGTKATLRSQIQDIARLNGVPGAAITAAQLAAMVERHSAKRYTHEQIRQILSVNREVEMADLEAGSGR